MSASKSIVDVHGFRMRLNPEDRAVSAVIAEERTWEPLETRIIEGRVGEGDVVVDVGANIGYYTLLLSQLVGEGGHVFAFEPEPTNFALLTQNVSLNDRENVTLVNAAVADTSGRLPLYLAGENKGDHRLFDSPEETRDSVLVDVVRLDAYFAEYPRALDFIKIDIQGSEGAVCGSYTTVFCTRKRVEHEQLLAYER